MVLPSRFALCTCIEETWQFRSLKGVVTGYGKMTVPSISNVSVKFVIVWRQNNYYLNSSKVTIICYSCIKDSENI